MSDLSDIAIKAARLEIERDEALARAKRAEDLLFALHTKDEEKILDTLHICGIPARSLKEIYERIGAA